LTGTIVFDHPGLVGVSERRKEALARKVGDEARLRQHGDICRAACLGVNYDLLLVVFRGRIFYVSAGCFTEILENNLNMALVVTAPGTEYGESFALEINLLQFIKIGPGELGIFARLIFEFGKSRGCYKNGSKRCA
jgi:hypothetical protein